MIYKVKKYYSSAVDRRQLLEEGYSRGLAALANLDEYKKQDFWPLLEKNLDKAKHYLDVGCGVGGWVLFLDEEGYKVQGVDESARVLRAMTEFNPDVVVKQGQLTALPYAAHHFDGVLSIGSLDHVENELEQAVAEIERVTKPGGVLILEMPYLSMMRKYKYLPFKMIETVVRRAMGSAEVFAGYMIDRASLRKLLEMKGFTIETMQPHDLPGKNEHYGLYMWPWFRGVKAYQLNVLGRFVKTICNAVSPWWIPAGIVVVARKK